MVSAKNEAGVEDGKLADLRSESDSRGATFGTLPFPWVKDYKPSTTWITKRLDWANLKPVIRSSVSAWICLVFMLVSKTQQRLGQVRFHYQYLYGGIDYITRLVF